MNDLIFIIPFIGNFMVKPAEKEGKLVVKQDCRRNKKYQ